MDGVNDRFWQFVADNIGADPARLRLKYHGRIADGFDIDLAILQIECRRRFGKKLAATLTAHPHWLFPTSLAGEQSTSDRLAAWHASLLGDARSVADLTAGLGIDVLHFSGHAERVYAVEIDPLKADALRYNFHDTNVSVVQADCRDWVGEASRVDCVFIDPARRASDGSRVYDLSDCQPDVSAMLPALRRVTDRLVVKLSPMLDISHTFQQLPQAHTIVSLGTETECKELVAIADLSGLIQTKTIKAVTLLNDGSERAVQFDAAGEGAIDIRALTVDPADGMWLYDPWPAVMKAGPYRTLCVDYGVKCISANTHLYLSDSYVPSFPGVAMQIERVIPFASKYIKRIKSTYPRINVICRNFDMPADRLRQKLGVADGGDLRLYAVTLAAGSKYMLIARPGR